MVGKCIDLISNKIESLESKTLVFEVEKSVKSVLMLLILENIAQENKQVKVLFRGLPINKKSSEFYQKVKDLLCPSLKIVTICDFADSFVYMMTRQEGSHKKFSLYDSHIPRHIRAAYMENLVNLSEGCLIKSSNQSIELTDNKFFPFKKFEETEFVESLTSIVNVWKMVVPKTNEVSERIEFVESLIQEMNK